MLQRFAIIGMAIMFCSVARAAEEPKLIVVKVEAERFDSITTPQSDGPNPSWVFEPVPVPPGSIFLGIRAQLGVEVRDPRDTSYFLQRKQILLTVAGADKPIQWTCMWGGYCQTFERAYMVVSKEAKDPQTVGLFFAVPKDAKVVTVAFGDQKVEVNVPTVTSKMDASKVVEAKVKRAVLVASVPDDKGKPVTNPDGKLLVVTVAWKTKAAQVVPPFPAHIFFHHWVNVKTAKGSVTSIGEMDTLKLTGYHDHKPNSIQTGGSEGNTIPTNETQFVFPVAADIKDFELTVLGTTMDKGHVGR